jgi:hypothetical protein
VKHFSYASGWNKNVGFFKFPFNFFCPLQWYICYALFLSSEEYKSFLYTLSSTIWYFSRILNKQNFCCNWHSVLLGLCSSLWLLILNVQHFYCSWILNKHKFDAIKWKWEALTAWNITSCLSHNLIINFFKACVIYNSQILHNLQHYTQYNNREIMQPFLRQWNIIVWQQWPDILKLHSSWLWVQKPQKKKQCYDIC